MTARNWYANLNYICNERCVFCASDLTNSVRLDHTRRSLTVDDVRTWISEDRPRAGDRVHLAGGEPTLHPQLAEIAHLLSADCADVRLYTNGLRLADHDVARRCIEAGISRFEIALYGRTADAHDAVTRVRGSYERTLAAFEILSELRRHREFRLVARLLVSRQTVEHNPGIIDVIAARAPRTDIVSVNRLILSDHAADSDATVSWRTARHAINETARRARAQGWAVELEAVPLCVLDQDVSAPALPSIRRRLAEARLPRTPGAFFYLDALPEPAPAAPTVRPDERALPTACRRCAASDACARVEPWYVQRYGEEGLTPLGVRVTTTGPVS